MIISENIFGACSFSLWYIFVEHTQLQKKETEFQFKQSAGRMWIKSRDEFCLKTAHKIFQMIKKQKIFENVKLCFLNEGLEYKKIYLDVILEFMCFVFMKSFILQSLIFLSKNNKFFIIFAEKIFFLQHIYGFCTSTKKIIKSPTKNE